MKCIKIFAFTTALLALSGCASLNPLSLLSEKPSLEVNAQVAKNAEQEKSVLKVESGTSNQKADKISNDTAYSAKNITQVTEQMPMWMFAVVIMLAGIAIDGKGFVNSFKNDSSKILVAVRHDIGALLKAPFNFILLLFGRDKL